MKIFTSLLLVCLSFPLFAQEYQCGTKDPTEEELSFFIQNNNFEHSAASFRNTSLLPVALKVHVVRQTAGVGGVSYEQLAVALANINSMFHEAGLEFYYLEEPTYVVNPQYYDLDLAAGESETTLQGLFTPASNAVNIYVMNSINTPAGTAAAGYVNFPANPATPPVVGLDDPYYNAVYMITDGMAQTPKSTLAHELGHYFGLLHTHRSTSNGNTNPDAEHVVRTGGNANCTVAGDLLCDTPADPYYNNGNLNLSNCTVTTTTNDVYGDPYTPELDNLMSYYAVHCGGVFTPDQDDRILTWYNMRLTHTNYSMTGTPQSVDVPTTINISNANNSYYAIDITWNDVASNEVGYVVECSTTSATEGFSAILGAGVGENETTYSHSNFTPNTTKWYRVKPINGDKDTYSPVAQVTTGVAYCPVESSGGYTCGPMDEYIDRVRIGTIDNNFSGCDPSTNGWQKFTNLSTAVTAGESYPITVNVNNSYPDDVCAVYTDWNRNGNFDDAGEKQILTGENGGIYTGNIFIPNDAVSGNILMRIRLAFNEDPQSCGTIGFGEAEDYVLNVSGVLPINLISFDGFIQKDEAILNWKTAMESNNKEFIIEHSTDGRTFSTIGNIQGQRTSEETHSYEFIHKDLHKDLNYYRLLQKDFNGMFSYSNTIVLSKKDEAHIEIYPNPVSNNSQLNIEFFTNNEYVTLTIVDILGRPIQVLNLDTTKGLNIVELSTLNLQPSNYFLKFEDGTHIQFKQFSIK